MDLADRAGLRGVLLAVGMDFVDFTWWCGTLAVSYTLTLGFADANSHC